MDQAAFQGYQSDQSAQQQYMTTQYSDRSDVAYRRTPSMSPNQMRVPPRRDRTPIQHHRRSVPRERSSSRTDVLLSYVSDQLQTQRQSQSISQAASTVVPSQSAPTTPQVYPMPGSYSAPPGIASASYGAPGGYFPQTMPEPEVEQMANYDFSRDPQYPEYYSMSRSASADVPDLNPHDTYLSPEVPHGVGPVPSIVTAMPSYPPVNHPLESSTTDVAVIPSRPKPQCWDHGCNGRQFSTFSNLLRHQREKSGSAMKAICPYCGTEFTRTTARNGHMYGGKCRAKESSEPSPPS